MSKLFADTGPLPLGPVGPGLVLKLVISRRLRFPRPVITNQPHLHQRLVTTKP